MADNEAIVPQVADHMAKLTITFNGQQGDLPDPVPYDSADTDLKRMATESVRDGYVPGIDAAPAVDFSDFVVDRFPSRPDVPFNRLSLRPKTPFGWKPLKRCRSCGYLQPKGSQRGDTCPSCDEAI